MPTVPIDLRMQQELRRLAETCADELDLPYDVLEPSGWTVRRLPDGRLWASHPAAGNAEKWMDRWKWHGEDMSWVRVP